MSIRQRLLVVVFLAGVTLAAAIASTLHILSTTESARVEAARTHALAAAQELADAYAGREVATNASIAAPTPQLLRWMQRESTTVMAATPRAEGGYCTREAIVVQARGRQDPRKVTLAPEHLAVVEQACATSDTRTDASLEKLRNNEVIAVATSQLSGGGAAWIAISVVTKTDPGQTVWQVEVAILALGTLLLIALSIDALFALRRGAAQLDASMARLQDDLRGDVTEPRAEELAAIAKGVKRMASHLADARDREQALGKKLAHEQRLAGLGRVAAGVAHEIRNPLAGLKLRLDLLARAPGMNDEAKQDVAACLDEIARLDRVVRSLLVVARRDPPEKKPIAWMRLVRERAAMAEEMAKAKNVTLTPKGEAEVSGNEDALARVIDNLVRNAIEASPENAEVTLTASTNDGVGQLDVIDRGAGVGREREAEMFEPFFTTKPEGTGLGLWLSRSLVESLGGTLTYAREGEATRFRVTLPAAKANG
jgi:signal transduction histidine kinase